MTVCKVKTGWNNVRLFFLRFRMMMASFKRFSSEPTQDGGQKIYLDMDGVLADFVGRLDQLLPNWQSQGESERWGLICSQGDFWATLDWLPEGKKLWDHVKRLDNVHILSAYSTRNDPASKL